MRQPIPFPSSQAIARAEIAIENHRAAEAADRSDLDPIDPRVILAQRTRAALEGYTLSPPKRDRLVKLATRLGMRPFDAHLVIAMVQDDARRGGNGNVDRNALRLVTDPGSGETDPPMVLEPSSSSALASIGVVMILAAALWIAALAWLHSGAI